MICSEHEKEIRRICFFDKCNKDERLLCEQCELKHDLGHSSHLKQYESVLDEYKQFLNLQQQFEPLSEHNQHLQNLATNAKKELSQKLKAHYERLQIEIKQAIMMDFEQTKVRLNEYFNFLDTNLNQNLSLLHKSAPILQQFKPEVHNFYKTIKDLKKQVKSHLYCDFVNEAVVQYNTLDREVFSKVKYNQMRLTHIINEEAPVLDEGNMKKLKHEVSSILKKFPICLLTTQKQTELQEDSLQQMTCVKEFVAHSDWVNCLCQLQANVVASGGADGLINIWNLTTFKDIQTLNHMGSVNYMEYISKKNQLLSCSSDKTIKQWDTHNKQPLVHTYVGHDKGVRYIKQLMHSSTFASAGSDTIIKIWNYNDFTNTQNIAGHFESILVLESLPESYLAAGGVEKTIAIWNLKTETTRITLKGHKEIVKTLLYMGDERTIVSGSQDNTIRVWNFITGDMIRLFEVNQGAVNALLYINNHNIIVAGSWDTTVKALNINSGQILMDLQWKSNYVQCLLYLNDGKTLISGSGDKNIRIWTIKEAQKQYQSKLGEDISNYNQNSNSNSNLQEQLQNGQKGSCKDCIIF